MLIDTCIKKKMWIEVSPGPVIQLASKEHSSLLSLSSFIS
jgi:hypothetical protein